MSGIWRKIFAWRGGFWGRNFAVRGGDYAKKRENFFAWCGAKYARQGEISTPQNAAKSAQKCRAHGGVSCKFSHGFSRRFSREVSRKFSRGFSLLEMLLALAVVAISAGGVVAAVESGARLHSYAILSEQIAQSEAKMLSLLAEPYGRVANSRLAGDFAGSREFFDEVGVASHSGQLTADGAKTRLNLAYDVDVSHAGEHKRIALTTRFGGGAVRLVGWAHNVGEMGAQDSRVIAGTFE